MPVAFSQRLLGSASLLVTAAAMIATPAMAQTASSATPTTNPVPNLSTSPPVIAIAPGNSAGTMTASAAEPADGLEAIVVTATRRSVNLQNVPATVEAVSASTLKAYNITGVLQLPSLVSGLVVTPSGGNNIYLRGIGSPSTGFNEAQTATYIDGLYLANPTASITSFNNVERIEVLKGPQGTLYGRNVTGGLISVTTRNPGKERRVDASVGYSSFNTLTLNLYGSTPLSDTLAVNVSAFHQKQKDGWSTNLFNGHPGQLSDETGIEAKLLWHPRASTKVTLTGLYDFNDRNYGSIYQVYPGTPRADGQPYALGSDGTPYYGKYKYVSRIDPSSPTRIYIGTLKVEQDLEFASLMSLTGYQTSHATVFFQGGLPILGQPVAGQGAQYLNFFEQNKTFSQEIQLTSKPSSSRFEWVAGTFYYDDHIDLRIDTSNTCVGNLCADQPKTATGPGFRPNRNEGFPTTLSGSVYGDGIYRLTDSTKVTVGLRYTTERKTLSGLTSPLPGFPNSVTALPPAATATTPGTVYYPGQPFPGNPTGIPTTLRFQRLTYRFVVAQDIGRDIHLYASHNLGFKSGAFNGNLFTNPPVRPELLYATEAGIKSELFNRMLRLNLAYFHYTYKDVQVRSQAPPAPPGNAILLNAASERLDGIDGDFTIAPTHGFVINGSFEYLKAKYVNFPGSSITSPRIVNGVVSNGVMTIQNVNLAGYELPFAPPFSATIGATYTLDTTAGRFSVSGNDHYNSPYSMNADNSVRQQRHHIVDASLNWTSPNKRYDLNLYVRNLTKQYTYAAALVSSNLTVVPGAPRIFGAIFGVHY